MVLDPQTRSSLTHAITEMPNLILSSSPGCGKGTFAHIYLSLTGSDFIWLNCSDETGVDAIRERVKGFACALGTSGVPKTVILNEADFCSINAQAMLRQLIEDTQKICRYMLLCNYDNKLIPELKSRCVCIDMSNPPLKDIVRYIGGILKSENIKVEDLSLVIGLVKDLYPDIRQMINVLQYNVVDGVISKIIMSINGDIYSEILRLIRLKDLDGIRKVLRSNGIDYVSLYGYIMDNGIGEMNNAGEAIILTAEYMYRNGFIGIKEVGFLSYVCELIKKGCV